MAKTPAASARKKTPARSGPPGTGGARGRGGGSRSKSKTPRSGARSTPKSNEAVTTSETILCETPSNQFFSAIQYVPRRDTFLKSDPLAPPTFGQSATDTWSISMGDMACIEAPVTSDVDDPDEFPPGPRRAKAPFTVGWRPCQILSLFREKVEVRKKLSTKKHWEWGQLQVEVRWFYRHGDLDDRNKRHEKSGGGACDKEEVLETDHVAVLDAWLLLGRLVLRRPDSEGSGEDFLQYPVPSVVQSCNRFYLRKEKDIFEAFDGEGMTRRGMECSKLLQNDHDVRTAAYGYLGLPLTETKTDAVKAEAVVALPSPLKTIKDKKAVSAYYSSCTIDHPWPQLTHGNLLCPPAKRDAFPKWQLCVGDIVGVHCFESAPASGLDVIPGRHKWYPYRVPWTHCQVIGIYRTFDKAGEVPGEESSVPTSALFCEIRWFPRVSEANAVSGGKKLATERLEDIAKDANRTSEEILEGDQVSTIHLGSLLGPVLIDNGPKSEEEHPVCRFLPQNRRTVSNTVKCDAAGKPVVATSWTDLGPTFRVRRGIDASDRYMGKAQRASILDSVQLRRNERVDQIRRAWPQNAAAGTATMPAAGGDAGSIAAELIDSESPQKKRQLFMGEYFEEEIAMSKKLKSSEGQAVPQDTTMPESRDQRQGSLKEENQSTGSHAARVSCPAAPFHVDVSAQKSFYEEMDLTPPVESYDDRFSAGGSAKPEKGQWKVKVGDTVNVEVEQTSSKESGVLFPFVVPWAPVEVVSIYKVHKTKESCARLRESTEDALATSHTQRVDPGEVMVEIRWFYRPWEIPGASKKKSESTIDGDLEEVFETDKIDICSADSILSPVRLHDTARPPDAPNAVMGMPCMHYHCGRLWSIHRRSFIPSGSLSNRVSRGRMYSEYKTVLDMLQAGTVEDVTSSDQQRGWKDAFNAAIQQLSLAAAAQDAQERGMVLACRKTERDHIRSFLKKAISGKSQYGRSYSRGREDEETMNVKSSMFVAGPPGTGKTASVKSVITELQKEQHEGLLPEFKFIALNGMELRRPFDAYIKFWEALSGTRKENLTAGNAANALEYYFCGDQFDESDDESEDSVRSDDESNDSDEEEDINVEKDEEVFKVAIAERPVTVLLLDEMDKLVTKKETLIYNLFDWPLRATTARLIVIGIANTINLPEKMSQRVQSRIGGNRCYFKSYNVADTMTILKSRLGVLDETPGYEVFEEDAIKFASRKAANLSGDIRKAFRMCKVAAETVYDDLISGKRPMPENQRPIVRISDVQKSSRDTFTSMVIKAVSHCVAYEALFMIALGALKRNREDGKFTIREILTKIESIANASGEPLYMDAHLSFSDVLGLASRLGSASMIQVDTYDSSPFPLVSTALEPYEINGALRDTKHAKLSGKHLANQRLF